MDLVILSACETGVDGIQAEKGVYSLNPALSGSQSKSGIINPVEYRQ